MKTDFERPFAEFERAIALITAQLGFAVDARRLRPRLGGMLRWDSLGTEEKKFAKQFMNRRDAELDDLSCGLYLVLFGEFEKLVYGAVQTSLQCIAERAPRFDALGEQIIHHHMAQTGRCLQTVFEPPDHISLDYYRMCEFLGSCVPTAAGQEFSLNLDAVAFGHAGITSRTRLDQVLARIAFKLRWDVLGQSALLLDFFQLKKPRETGHAAEAFLLRFMRNRNVAAHRGFGSTTAGQGELERAIAYFKAFVPAFRKQLRSHVDGFKYK